MTQLDEKALDRVIEKYAKPIYGKTGVPDAIVRDHLKQFAGEYLASLPSSPVTHLDEKAKRAARQWAIEAASENGVPGNEYVDGILTAYIAALPSSPVSDLVDALMEWSRPDTGSHDAGVQLVCEQAASTLTTLSTRNAELEREVKRLREAQQWQPIETAPKDGSVILCAWFDDDGTTYAIAGWYEPGIADRCWYDQYDDVICFTHWMPLPSPPAVLSTSPQGGEHE